MNEAPKIPHDGGWVEYEEPDSEGDRAGNESGTGGGVRIPSGEKKIDDISEQIWPDKKLPPSTKNEFTETN